MNGMGSMNDMYVASSNIKLACLLFFFPTLIGCFRMHLFRLKRLLRNYFIALCVFGTYGKFGQIEISLHVDSKKPLLTHKTILVLILPSIVLHFSHNPHTLLTHTLQAQL